MTKNFNVGDKVRILDTSASRHNEGDIGIFIGITPYLSATFYDVDVDGVTQGYYDYQLELVAKPTKNQRITELESKVVELEAKFEALREALQ